MAEGGPPPPLVLQVLFLKELGPGDFESRLQIQTPPLRWPRWVPSRICLVLVSGPFHGDATANSRAPPLAFGWPCRVPREPLSCLGSSGTHPRGPRSPRWDPLSFHVAGVAREQSHSSPAQTREVRRGFHRLGKDLIRSQALGECCCTLVGGSKIRRMVPRLAVSCPCLCRCSAGRLAEPWPF
jgi:hypothetical protein